MAGGLKQLKLRVLRGKTLATVTNATADGTVDAVAGFANYSSLTFRLETTSLGADATDTLDVLIQRLLPQTGADEAAGTEVWDTIVRFPQIDGADSADQFVADVNVGTSDDAARVADDDVGTIGNVTLAAAGVRSVPWGDKLRVAYIITSGNSADFDFDVTVDARV